MSTQHFYFFGILLTPFQHQIIHSFNTFTECTVAVDVSLIFFFFLLKGFASTPFNLDSFTDWFSTAGNVAGALMAQWLHRLVRCLWGISLKDLCLRRVVLEEEVHNSMHCYRGLESCLFKLFKPSTNL